MSTKGGTNTLHGAAVEARRNQVLDARRVRREHLKRTASSEVHWFKRVARAKKSSAADAQAVRLELARILASAEFSAAERMRRFLELSVSEALDGRESQLKEYTIGVAVFDRPASFDPTADPIVRVEARRLRAKLERYYETEGRGDCVRIELPKGGYAPVFTRREDTPAPVPARSSKVIAVLPFQSVGSSEDSRYFSEGLTWELIHQLTRVKDLAVAAWNSAAQAGEVSDPVAAGAKLKAAAVLTGSVRCAGERLRIVVQLVDVATGVYLWSETYDTRMEDILAVQDDIARSIVVRLQTRLYQPEQVRTGYNVQAYQLYLQGRAHWNQRSAEGLVRALENFRHAAEIDANFALAWAGIADALALQADYGFEWPAVVMPAARRAAMKALEIDPTLGEAHCSLGFILGLHDWKWAEAEAHFRRALDLNPSYATAHHWLGVDFLAALGRFEEALDELAIARQLDPLSMIIAEGRGYVLMLARRYEEAEDHLRSLLESHQSFFKAPAALGRVLIQSGRYDEAIDLLEAARRAAGELPSAVAAMAQAHALNGNLEKSAELLETLHASSKVRYVSSTAFAIVHGARGERAEAIEWLRRGLRQHEISMSLLAVHPVYDCLRAEPGFSEILAQLGLSGIGSLAAVARPSRTPSE